MSEQTKAQDEFGCESCWPASADAAWKGIQRLTVRNNLIDESHYMVKLQQCPACNQSFVTVFTETIDWIDGEDPQYRTVMPLREPEVTALIEADLQGLETKLRTLAPSRQSLKSDFPKGKDLMQYWSKGIVVGSHD